MDPLTPPAALPIPGAFAPKREDDEDRKDDPLAKLWSDRAKQADKHWKREFERMQYCRKLVRGIDETADAKTPQYNKHRANLIASTLTVVLSKVYAKNPEMSAEPTNKAQDLALFADTVSTVTQRMLEDANLKRRAKSMVKAAMTCKYGVVKLQYQRVTAADNDPIIRQRIADTQDNLQRLQHLISEMEEGDDSRCEEERNLAQLQQTLAGLEAQAEVVAAEGLVIDRVPSDRLLIDPAVEDFYEYPTASWMIEKIPMRKSEAEAKFPDGEFDHATTYNVGDKQKGVKAEGQIFAPAKPGEGEDPIVMILECWSRLDNRVYTLVEGCAKQFIRPPYTPQLAPERWWPYHLLPFQSVDGEFSAQSLVDVCERLQEEHNETRDKFAEVRRNIRPSRVLSGDLREKDVEKVVWPGIGEAIVIKTDGQPIGNFIQPTPQLQIDPAVYDTSPIRNDWEMVSGLQDAARSTVIQPKTATEAAISDQALSARVGEFRDEIEDVLTEIGQAASELCLLAMTPQMVETIMGKPKMPTPAEAVQGALTGQPPEEPEPTYYWPAERRPETVFNLIQLKVRSGSTAAPNQLKRQETWTRAMPILMDLAMKIRQIEAGGGDASAEREIAKETAARFDETIDVERFLPPKPSAAAALPPAAMPGATPGALPAGPGAQPAGPPLPPGMPLPIPADAGVPMQGGQPLPSPMTLQ